jgi:hypothetical protein
LSPTAGTVAAVPASPENVLACRRRRQQPGRRVPARLAEVAADRRDLGDSPPDPAIRALLRPSIAATATVG